MYPEINNKNLIISHAFISCLSFGLSFFIYKKYFYLDKYIKLKHNEHKYLVRLFNSENKELFVRFYIENPESIDKKIIFLEECNNCSIKIENLDNKKITNVKNFNGSIYHFNQ